MGRFINEKTKLYLHRAKVSLNKRNFSTHKRFFKTLFKRFTLIPKPICNFCSSMKLLTQKIHVPVGKVSYYFYLKTCFGARTRGIQSFIQQLICLQFKERASLVQRHKLLSIDALFIYMYVSPLLPTCVYIIAKYLCLSLLCLFLFLCKYIQSKQETVKFLVCVYLVLVYILCQRRWQRGKVPDFKN